MTGGMLHEAAGNTKRTLSLQLGMPVPADIQTFKNPQDVALVRLDPRG